MPTITERMRARPLRALGTGAALAAGAMLLAMAGWAGLAPAWADRDRHDDDHAERHERHERHRDERQDGRSAGRRGVAAAPLPAYQQECGSCHVAYPPGLLPAASWQRVMAGLSRHYGTDASLDGATTQAIADWVAPQAGRSRRVQRDGGAPPEDRITRSAWFLDEHDEVAAAVWKRPSVKSAANCAACHAGAERGDFDEHDVRIPR